MGDDLDGTFLTIGHTFHPCKCYSYLLSNRSLYFLMRSGENVVSSVIPLELASNCCCDLDSLVTIISGLKE